MTNNYVIPLFILAFGFVILMFLIIIFDKKRFIFESISPLYIGIPMLASIYLYNRFGLLVLSFLFIITVSTDTFAYFTGRYFKGMLLAPAISPGKTVSGAIGGIIGTFIFSSAYLMFLFLSMGIDTISSFPMFMLIAMILSILSQCGDLFESYCKRIADIKDSSNLIRGHGGILDRLDGFIAIVPIYALLVIVSMSLL
jgi:phosphatidate cytidylyltransferase